MKTTESETLPDATIPGNDAIAEETTRRMVFFGPNELSLLLAFSKKALATLLTN